MSVYVDDIVDYGQLARSCGLRTTRWAHLTADDRDELHAFAGRIGLRRAWFQDHAYRWHYDVTPGKRAAAIAAGAKAIDWREMAHLVTARRTPTGPKEGTR